MLLFRIGLRRTVLLGFLLSLAIEVTKFVLDVTISTGRVADFDDLIADTLGTLIGALLVLIVRRNGETRAPRSGERGSRR